MTIGNRCRNHPTARFVLRCLRGFLLLIVALSTRAHSQERFRWFAAGEAGYTRIWDDEGLLGSGMGLGGTLGHGVTPRLRLQALVHRIPYYRNVEHLTFDGRVWFAGGEAAFETSARTVHPFVTVGAGIFNDEGVWIQKTLIGFGQTRVDTEIARHFTLTALTASGGLDIPLGRRASLRLGLRFYGLLDTGDDLSPHTILQPGVGIAWRW